MTALSSQMTNLGGKLFAIWVIWYDDWLHDTVVMLNIRKFLHMSLVAQLNYQINFVY